VEPPLDAFCLLRDPRQLFTCLFIFMPAQSLDTLVSLCKRRGFIFPGSDIYGGLANSWDYGPLGTELKRNIVEAWWKKFVSRRTDMVGLDAAIIMNPKVWEASGHLAEFTDPLVECKKCHTRFRADQIDTEVACGHCGTKGEFTVPKNFNLMFKTFLGSTEDASSTAFLRGELAQAMFVDFTLVRESSRKRVPFGIAQVGKCFRNEITPGNFTFRTREFNLMEFEYFVHPSEWEKHFEYWLTQSGCASVACAKSILYFTKFQMASARIIPLAP
jgi:glycyl-tRNA synthetase